MTFPEPQLITLTDPDYGRIELSVHEQGTGPAVVFSHGFPELAYSWRHQLPAVAAAGFRAIAPDQRGYGGSTAPEPVAAYGMDQLTGDLVRLLDELGLDQAVFVGHDWGGFVVWAMGVLHPERCAGIVGVCTPYLPFPGTDFLKMLVDGDVERQYMLWFQEPGVAEREMDPRARVLFEKLMVGGVDPRIIAERAMADGKLNMNPFIDLDGLEPLGESIADADVVDHYASVFERTGFRGGINWYRNVDANSAAHPEVGTTVLSMPTLMLCAEWDPALPPALAAGMPNVCSDFETHTIPKAGHWVQQESPDAVNELLLDWLQRRFGSA
ncbi:MAG TPA: alpha/beta hydrolase [Microthrixaceae bacterium]|nr:alpha/beta hydrolase [Microthrixaceae bacterium]